jgi:hypothetical protein
LTSSAVLAECQDPTYAGAQAATESCFNLMDSPPSPPRTIPGAEPPSFKTAGVGASAWPSSGSGFLRGALGGRGARGVALAVLASLASIVAAACSREPPPGASLSGPGGQRVSVIPTIGGSATQPGKGAQPGGSVAMAGAVPVSSALPDNLVKVLEAIEQGAAPEAPAPAGEAPMLGVPGAQAQIFSSPASTRDSRIGYIRRGGKVAVLDPTPVKGKHCDAGWYRLKPVGYVCAKYVTTNLNDPQVRFGVKEPTFDEVLPYKYASNVAHGTPLYRTVPSREEMAIYEPYLKLGQKHREERTASADSTESPKKKKKKRKGKRGSSLEGARDAGRDADREGQAEEPKRSARDDDDADAGAPAPSASTAPDAGAPQQAPAASAQASAAGEPQPQADLDGGAADAGEDESTKPWWQRKYEAGKHPEIKLSDLTEDADKTLSRRMAKGFYVAVDRTFLMNGRGWHKTTAGLIAPADRMAVVKPNAFHGQEIDEQHATNAVAFVLPKSAAKYQLDEARKAAKPSGGLARYDRAFLTGQTATVGSRMFREAVDGFWVRDSDVAITEPGSPPASLKPGEKWVDVNLSHQTLVAFEGTRAVYATLISTGRKGRDKAHDHTTPKGMWRVREKHVAATMDGDGAASGDMPYSIEDVPYVLYFHESYALHGAFWHDNFGRQQSHGCVNLAPLDAKRIFFWSEPALPQGWHGIFSTPEMPGTLVVVHD